MPRQSHHLFHDNQSEAQADFSEKKEIDKKTKNLNRFDLYYDDSSDEEELESERRNFDINLNWKAYQAAKKNKQKKQSCLANDELLSFIAHSAGIELFYSREVSEIYYRLKKTIFHPEEERPDGLAKLNAKLKTAILDSFKQGIHAAKSYLKFSKIDKNFQNEIILKLQTFQERFLNQTEAILEKQKESFKCWVDQHQHGVLHENDYFIQFQKQLLALFEKIFCTQFEDHKKSVNVVEIKNKLLTLARELIEELIEKYELNEKLNMAGKNDALGLLANDQSPYQEIVGLLKKIIEQSQARGKVSTIIQGKLQDETIEKEIIRAFLQDLCKKRKLNMKFLEKEQKVFEAYYEFSFCKLYDAILDVFSNKLSANLLRAFSHMARPTLGKYYYFESDKPLSFLANLRVASRSQKRQTRNLQFSLFKQDCVARIYCINPQLKKEDAVLERQEILPSFGRRDMVEGLGNYEKIRNFIQQIKLATEDKISDADLAIWLRSIYKGEPLPNLDKEILQKLHAICYLLFGCEAIRNPSMHIINQMLLDLIIENKGWDFEQAFTLPAENEVGDKLNMMPMAPEGAVAAARALEVEYRSFMPHAYSYPGAFDEQQKPELIKLEANVVRAWFTLILKDKTIESLKKENVVKDLLDKIKMHYEKWFGIVSFSPRKSLRSI